MSDASDALVPLSDHVADVRPLVRLYSSKHTHRLLPAPVALAIAAAAGPPGGRRRRADERRRAERFMKDLLLHTPHAGHARALTRRYLRERSRINELVWRPWLIKRSRLIGAEHWDAARSDGRPCVVVIGHMGATFAVPAILARHEIDVHMVTSRHYWEPLPPGLIGRVILHLRREYGEKALGWSRLIPNDAPPEQLIELLEGGISIVIAFDVPGSAATPFLGRSVALAGGPATLAFRTRAKVLPAIPERHGSRIDLRLLEPLDPEGYGDVRSLRAAIARTFELLILEKPEIVELPWYPSPLVTEASSLPRRGEGPTGASA